MSVTGNFEPVVQKWLKQHGSTLHEFLELWDRFIEAKGRHLAGHTYGAATEPARRAFADLFDQIAPAPPGLQRARWEWSAAGADARKGTFALAGVGETYVCPHGAFPEWTLSIDFGSERDAYGRGALRLWTRLPNKEQRRAAARQQGESVVADWFRGIWDMNKAWPTRGPLMNAVRRYLRDVEDERYAHIHELCAGMSMRLAVCLWEFDRRALEAPESWLDELGRRILDARRTIADLTGPDLQPLNSAAAEIGVFPEDGPPPPPRRTNPEVARLESHLRANLCVVLQGPPGTGKTWLAQRLVEHLAGSEGMADACQLSALVATTESPDDSSERRFEALVADEARLRALPLVWEMVQLHPGYTYEDLVRGLVTDSSESAQGGIRFVSRDGVLLQMARVADVRRDGPTLLVLDEINRCNLASVLGELIVALEKDKRDRLVVRLQYPGRDTRGDSLRLPANLWVLGTMNTADRSIALVDYAIRRRFRFLDVQPDPTVIDRVYVDAKRAARVRALMEAVNEHVTEPRLRVGHSYFLPTEANGGQWAEALADKLIWEVVPLLREYRLEHCIKASEIGLNGFAVKLDFAPSELSAVREGVIAFLEET